ncbi:MAG: magnesium transporter [Myxococcales bacterium]|nr:magnesium transporter [Myxococcales bacterium]|tara:strand:+ start:1082 stop:1762 length:681 start_codon:yes stop_codon:yes gene_type:complete
MEFFELPNILKCLGVAALCGGLIGLERETHGQAAGLRTHMILAVGGALASIISIAFSGPVAREFGAVNGDPGRVAAQVISGIGFLGAGAIIRYGITIKGLTTAASLFTTAIIGLAAGMGEFQIAMVTATMVIVALVLLDIVEKKVVRPATTHYLNMSLTDRPGVVRDLKVVLDEQGLRVISAGFIKDVSKNQVDLELMVKVPHQLRLDGLIGHLSGFESVRRIELR